MSCSIKLYKLNEFIRKDETSEIDFEWFSDISELKS